MIYQDCIRLAMIIIEKLLNEGIEIRNELNLNLKTIELHDEGLVIHEESRFNAPYSYGASDVLVSPSYLINILFSSSTEYGDNLGEPLINYFIEEISEEEFAQSISYTYLVDCLESLRNLEAKSDNVLSLDYYKLKMMLSKVKKDDYYSLKNSILSIKNLSFSELANINIKRPTLARRIERLYKLEKLLTIYAKKSILECKYDCEIDWDLELDGSYKEMLDGIDLSKEQVPWAFFCKAIESYNKVQQKEDTKQFLDYKDKLGKYNPKLSVLGLDDKHLPGNPSVYCKK